MSDRITEALDQNQAKAQQHNAMMVTMFQQFLAEQRKNTAALKAVKSTNKSLKATVRNFVTHTVEMNATLDTINSSLASLDRRHPAHPLPLHHPAIGTAAGLKSTHLGVMTSKREVIS